MSVRQGQAAVGSRDRAPDPVLTEVIKNELFAICEEMAISVSRTARSVMVRSGDFAASISDDEGRLIGPGYAAPIQIAHFAETLGVIRQRFGAFEPGDVVISNDPYGGMGHFPDIGVFVPVFSSDRLVGFAHSYSHHTDIGGRFPGGISSWAESTYEEGIRIPATRLYSAGRRNDALVETILANVRGGDVWLGDLEAKVAGCQRGAQELVRVIENHGFDAYHACCDHLIRESERALVRAIEAIPDGRYTNREVFEDDGSGRALLDVVLTLEVSGSRIVADFAGTAGQVRNGMNLPFTMAKAMVCAALKVLVSAETLLNAGFMSPIVVRAPSRSLVNPEYPAPVAGRAPLAFFVFDLALRTLAEAVPGMIPVPGEGGDLLHFTSQDRDRLALDTFFGGWGARPTKDGIDGVAPLAFGAYGTSSAELLERETGIVIEEFGFVPDTEGAGRFRGSLAVRRTWRFQTPGSALVRRGRLAPSEGFAGGLSGASPVTIVNGSDSTERLPRQTHTHVEVGAGDRIRHSVAGTGGYGDPLERNPQLVLKDVRDGKVSAARAREVYGVELNESGHGVDEEKTALRRAFKAPPRGAK